MARSPADGDWSDSEFDENSDFQSSQEGMDAKATPVKNGKGPIKNQAYDEAVDLSSSDTSISHGNPTPQRGAKPTGDQGAFDEGQDESGSSSEPKPGRRDSGSGAKGAPPQSKATAGGGGAGPVANKPFDEAHSLGDESGDLSSEDSIMTNDSEPKGGGGRSGAGVAAAPGAKPGGGGAGAESAPMTGSTAVSSFAPQQQQQRAGEDAKASANITASKLDESSEASESDEDDDDEDDPIGGGRSGGVGGSAAGVAGGGAAGGGSSGSGGARTPAAGEYNPKDFAHLPVSSEVKDLFQYISRYKPHEVELDTSLKCFIPDFIPAVGEMDAFIKVPPPDGTRDELGLKVLDEPAARQSDATVLELQLRAASKKQHGDLAIRSIENAAKNPGEVEKWIKSITDLHRNKPAVEVHYKRNMPDVDSLMQEWAPELDELLRDGSLPLPKPEMDLTTEEYARVLCALVDVPVYDSVPESLHLVFALYTAFKENPHFAARSKANQAQNIGANNGGGPVSSGGGQGSRSGGGGQLMNVDGADVFSLE